MDINVVIVVRERGKIVTTREVHNIWTTTGRSYLASLLSYATFVPSVTTETDHRVRYMGFGIGGDKQIAPTIADSVLLLSHYPNPYAVNQTSTNTGVVQLQRPVRFSWVTASPHHALGSVPYTYPNTDVWLHEVVDPPTHPTSSSVEFELVVAYPDMIDATRFPVVPISEIGLFTNAASIHAYNNAPVAYATFETIQVTTNPDVVMTVSWTVRF